MKETGHLGELGIDGRIILKKKGYGDVEWVRVTQDGLSTCSMTFVLHKAWGIFLTARHGT